MHHQDRNPSVTRHRGHMHRWALGQRERNRRRPVRLEPARCEFDCRRFSHARRSNQPCPLLSATRRSWASGKALLRWRLQPTPYNKSVLLLCLLNSSVSFSSPLHSLGCLLGGRPILLQKSESKFHLCAIKFPG